MNKGVSFLEVIIVMAILGIIIGVMAPSLSNFRNQQILKNTSEDIITILNKARSQTLSSLNLNYYSVHFETNKAVLFIDGTYSESSLSNEIISLDNHIEISDIALNGSDVDVKFNRLIGDTNQYGTITIQITSDISKQKIITVSQTGVISSN